MRTLVTGGAGFIGSNLVRQLLANGDQVTVLDNLSSGDRRNIESLHGVRFIEDDIRDESAVREAIRDVDVVFHLAASVGNKRSIDKPVLDAAVNVMGTLNVLEAAREAGVKKIVASSSAGIFGELRMIPVAEDHPIEPDSPYGSSKLCMEKECLAYAKVFGIEAICLRYFNVYGTNQRFDAYGNVIPIFVFKLLRNETLTVYGDGEQTRDFVNVRDVVQANIRAAAVGGVTGAFNIGSGSRITINALIEAIETASGMRPRVMLSAQRKGDVLHSVADIAAARRVLGFAPTISVAEGLSEYLRWAKVELTARNATADESTA